MEKSAQVVSKVIGLRDASMTGWSESLIKSRIVQNHVMHEPYSRKQKQDAERFKKPLLRYNVIVSKLLGLEGQEYANRRAVYFQSKDPEQSGLIQLLQDNWEFINNQERLQYKLIKSMVDGIMYPHMGWIRRSIVLDDYGYLTFKYDNIDTFSVNPDPSFKNLDLSDCRYITVDEWLTKEEIARKYKPRVFTDEEQKLDWQSVGNRAGDNYYGSTECIDGDRHLVVQLEEKLSERVSVCIYDNNTVTLTDEEIKGLQGRGKKVRVIKDSIEDRIKLTTVLPSHKVVLKEEVVPYNSKRFSFFATSSYDWVMEKRKQPSLMYILTDIQDSISKSKSQHIDFMTQQLVENYSVAATESEAIQAIKESRGEPFRVIPYRNIQNRVPRESGVQNAGALSSIQSDILMSMEFITEVSNITPAMEGKGGKSGESGTLFEAKVSRGLVATNPYYEIKANTNLQLAMDYLELAPEVYFEDDRILTIQDKTTSKIGHSFINLEFEGVKYNDIKKAKSLALLDNGDNTQARLEATFEENLGMVQVLINSGVPPETIPWEIIIKNSNIRDKEVWINSLLEAKGLMEMNAVDAMTEKQLATEAAVAQQ